MKIILGLCALIFLNSMALAIPGGCGPVGEDGKEDAEAGKKKLISVLEQGVNNEPGYKTTVNLPDLSVCAQVVAGTLYHYTWNKVEYKTECTHNPKSNSLCLPEKEKTSTENKDCSATYWTKVWDKSFKPEFKGPECT